MSGLDFASYQLRMLRNFKLSACDFTQLPDNTLTTEVKTAWAAYRQALRDLPANIEDPANPVWPMPPTSPLIGGINDVLNPIWSMPIDEGADNV